MSAFMKTKKPEESRYRFLFENVPISLWEEDFSQVRLFLENLKKKGVQDLRQHFTAHPDDLRACVEKVRVVDVNPFTLTLYQYPSKVALTKGLVQTFGPESYSVFREELVSLFNGEMEFQTEAVTYKSTGEKIVIHIAVRIPEEHRHDWAQVLVSITDITSRVKMEQALRESERKFRGVVETSADGIVITDEQGRVVQWNHSAEKIFGIPKEKAIGQPLYKLQMLVTPKEKKTPEIKQAVRKRLTDFFETGMAPWLNRRYETKIQLPNGQIKIIESVAFPVHTSRGAILASHIRDVTERIQAEEAMRRSLAEKEILLKEIHHRVKNNLQIVSSLLRLQANGISDSRTAQILLESQNRIRTMGLIHEKLYSGQLDRIHFEDYARSLVEEIFAASQTDKQKIQFAIEAKNITLNISQAVSCGLILNELVTNALKYAFPVSFFRTGRKRAIISVSMKKISENSLELAISDNGVGFPDHFDWQQPESLGLRLVKILAEDQLRGMLSVQSGAGTQFTIRFKEEKTNAQT